MSLLYTGTPTDQELEALYEESNKFALLSHIFWGCWALVQAHVSNIDFDYMQYAGDRFSAFLKRRK
jgi:ethanolamine kinase